MPKEVIFVVDPMCSWCWGFAPILESLRLNTHYECSVVLGGLRGKGQMEWNESSKFYLQGHWEQVAKRTGQPFNTTFFKKEVFDYNTHIACKAIISVRELFGMQKAFEYLNILQEAFYVQNKDITQVDVLVDLLVSLKIESEVFKTFYESDRADILMKHDCAKARSMGANAFPSIVIIDSDGHMVCQTGYKSLEEMNRLLKEYDA